MIKIVGFLTPFPLRHFRSILAHRGEEHAMASHRRDAYSAFAEDHRQLGAAKGPLSPTLRIKALAAAVLAGALFWSAVIYFIIR
ncbi:MAG: hypothetical protein AAAB11_06080 [Rhizobium giardinii]